METPEHFAYDPMVFDVSSPKYSRIPTDRLSNQAFSLQQGGELLSSQACRSPPLVQELRRERNKLEHEVFDLRKQVKLVPQLEQEMLYHADRADHLQNMIIELTERNKALEVMAHARGRSKSVMAGARIIRILTRTRYDNVRQRALAQWRVAAALVTMCNTHANTSSSSSTRHGGASTSEPQPPQPPQPPTLPPPRRPSPPPQQLARDSSAADSLPRQPSPLPPYRQPPTAQSSDELLAALQFENLKLQQAAAQQASLQARAMAAATLLAVMRRREDWILSSSWSKWRAIAFPSGAPLGDSSRASTQTPAGRLAHASASSPGYQYRFTVPKPYG